MRDRVGALEVRVRDYWWAHVLANLRSTHGIALLVVGGGAAVWQFVVGHTSAGVGIAAVLLFYYACVGAAIGAWLGVRDRRRGS